MRFTRTHTISEIAIIVGTDGNYIILAQDFSHDSVGQKHSDTYKRVASEAQARSGYGPPHLDPNHIRKFDSMALLSEWLAEVGAWMGTCMIYASGRDFGEAD